MRAAHSLKGAARMIGYTAAVGVAHAMEDYFVAVQESRVVPTLDAVDALLNATDLLARLSHASEMAIISGDVAEQGEIDAIIPQLEAATTAKPLAPPSPLPAVPASESAAPVPVSAESADRAVRVTADNLNRMLDLAGELLVASRWLTAFMGTTSREARKGVTLDTITHAVAELESFDVRLGRISQRLYDGILASRMRPFSDGIQGFPRMVRDVARALGKDVRLQIVGEKTNVDRDILQRLDTPLGHLLRNAVDHGIEVPDERLAHGKPAQGVIQLEARHSGGMLSITVTDDGRGVDPESIRAKVIERRLTDPDVATRLSESELLEFLFLPGFSTRQEVTDISGRGVGLDAVKTMLKDVGGTVDVVSRPGAGMRFQMLLPLTLSVARVLLASVADEPYAIPLARVIRVLMLVPDDINSVEGREQFLLDGEPVSLVSMRDLFDIGGTAPARRRFPVIVVGDRALRYGLVIDEFLGEREVVVRPLDARLGKVRDVSAAALMPDGSPALILDIDDVVRSIDAYVSGGRIGTVRSSASDVTDTVRHARPRILVIDDSLTVRETERKLLEGAGYLVDVAVDGMDGWNAIRVGQYALIITDVDMPRLDGIELTKLIRADARLRSIPVMIMSYKDREEDRMRGLDAGADYYLTKASFHDDTLLRAVADLVGEHVA
jgi:two-component system sensor histidine kinase and response regulator WspE